MFRAVITTMVFTGLLLYLFWQYQSSTYQDGDIEHTPADTHLADFLPDDDHSDIIHHQYYSLGYNENLEQANWVAYHLTEESLRIKNVKRARDFKKDPKVRTRSSVHSDYSHSGYTRGHMAPAGDMAFSKLAMQESFYMSNMSPQLRNFNNGVWRELEENVRDWAYDNDELYIVSGPIFYNKRYKRIGKNKVAVPDAFYKTILDLKGSKKKSIGFIIPHEKTEKHLREFAVSVDQVEEVTGINFYKNLYSDLEQEHDLESVSDASKWAVNRKTFEERKRNWNNQK